MSTSQVSRSYSKIAAIIAIVTAVLWVGLSIYQPENELDSTESESPVDLRRTERSSGGVVYSLAHGSRGVRMDDLLMLELASLEQLARENPAQALSKLDSLSDENERGLALAAIGRGWGKLDPDAAAQWIDGLELEVDQVNAALGLAPVWADKNLDSAWNWAHSRAENSILRELSIMEIADVWGGKFPQQAMDKLLNTSTEAGIERGLHAVSTQWALNEPDQALSYFSALDPEGRRDEFLEAALVALTNQNPKLSWQEAHRVGKPGRVAHVQAQALEAIAESQPQEALRLAATDGDSRLNYLGIARGWSYLNPQDAQAWAGSLEDADLRQEVLAVISQSGDTPSPEE